MNTPKPEPEILKVMDDWIEYIQSYPMSRLTEGDYQKFTRDLMYWVDYIKQSKNA